jgi:hypothetical protein
MINKCTSGLNRSVSFHDISVGSTYLVHKDSYCSLRKNSHILSGWCRFESNQVVRRRYKK